MTEIPEHLLKRSKERRGALGLGGDAGDAPAADAPAGGAVEKATSAAPPETAAGGGGGVAVPPSKAPAAAAAPAPKPVRPEVAAYQQRKRIPFWAVPVLALMPVWAFVYAFTLDPPTRTDPILEEASAVYSSFGCGGCHGAAGGGGVGPSFVNGAVGETFSDWEEMAEWIRLGSQGWIAAYGDTYGDDASPVLGFNGSPMPAHPDMSEEDLALVVRYEREVLGGLPPEQSLLEATGVDPAEAEALVAEAEG